MDKTFYSPYPSLAVEVIKDVLCKFLGLVRTIELCALQYCRVHKHGGHGNAFCMSLAPRSKARGSVTVIPVSRVQLHRGLRGARMSPSISIVRSCLQLPWQHLGGVACETGAGLKFTPLYLHMSTPYRFKAKEPPRAQCRACRKQINW